MATTQRAKHSRAAKEAAVAEALDRLIEGLDAPIELMRENWDMQRRIDINREAVRRFKNDYPERAQ